MAARQGELFPEINTAPYGDNRRKRPLFIPNHLKEESQDNRLRSAAQNNAYEIILRWAELETSGKLEREKETALEGEFLTQIFGEALGYTLFSEGKQEWHLKPKFYVNGGEADAAIGMFQSGQKHFPRAIIELKGPNVNVDRDKFNGRTPVQQCWDYLNALPVCPWGIVCNFVSFRLYHRNYTPRIYELFTLQELRKEENFLQFYCLFEKGGFLPTALGQTPRADRLLERINKRQREVGDELYEDYHQNRLRLIQHLTSEPHNKPLDNAIKIAQKLIDRIVFIAFCEDRELLPDKSLYKAWSQIAPFHRVTNPRWRNFIDLFRSIDEGNKQRGISPYDGGLFRKDNEVDGIDLEDEWTNFFKSIGDYDFRYEVNVDVLGHLFEKSINDIEKIRLGGLFEPKAIEVVSPKMKRSAERKRGGIYYTPPEFTEFITKNTVAKLSEEKIENIAAQYNIDLNNVDTTKSDGKVERFALESIDALRQIKIVDPACGSGAFLIKAYDILEEKYQDLIDILDFHNSTQAEKLREKISGFILNDNLFGVDLSPEAVEITQLALWLRSAQKGKSLADLSKNIICGNSLVTDPVVDPHALDWQKTFSEIFSRQNPGFDCVIGNPPWERIKLQEREFFDAIIPSIATAVDAATRRNLITKLKRTRPELHQQYAEAKKSAEKTLDHVRNCARFPLTGKGDINTYAVFAELARNIVAPSGRVGLLVPSGIGTEHTTKNFFATLTDNQSLIGFYDFENTAPIFPDVHRSYKFCVLIFGGQKFMSESADFVFFAHQIDELKDKNRHVKLTAKDIKLLNPNTRTCPVFRSNRDAEITKFIYRRVPILVDKARKEGGSPWGVKFLRMFDQTNNAELFRTADQLKKSGFKCHGHIWKKGKQTFLPLCEAKMFRSFDHRFGSVYIKDANWMNQGQTFESSLVEHQNPDFIVFPRWWASESEILGRVNIPSSRAFLAFRNVTRATDTRTVIASFIPAVGVINSAPIVLFKSDIGPRLQSCLLANLNTFILDFVAKRKIPNVNLNYFVLEQLPMFPPDLYCERCPWDKRKTLEKWISERVLKLTCTSNDMKPLAEAAGFKPLVNKWNPAERANLMAELDSAFFLLYGIDRNDIEYILSTFSGVRKEQDSIFVGSTTFDRILSYYDKLHEKCH